MPGLILRDEAAGGAWQVWPDAEPVPAGRSRKRAAISSSFTTWRPGADTTLLIDDTELEGLRPRGGAVARWRWSPGFHAGTVKAELRIAGRAHSASRS